MRRSDVMALGVILGGAGFGLMATSQLLSARPAGQFDSLRHESRVIRVWAPSVETVISMVCEDEAAIEVNLDGLNIAMQKLHIRLSTIQERKLETELEGISAEVEARLVEELEYAGVEGESAGSEFDEARRAVAEAQTMVFQILQEAKVGQEFAIQNPTRNRALGGSAGGVDLQTLHSDSDDNRKCKRRRHPPRILIRVRKIDRP